MYSTFSDFSSVLAFIFNNVNLFEIFHLEKETENALNSFKKSDFSKKLANIF